MKSLRLVPALLLPLFALATACGDSSKKSTEGEKAIKVSGQDVVVVDGTVSGDNGLAGNGKVAFVAPLANDANGYDLSFSLEDGGSLTLVGNAATGLKEGVELKFTRQDKKLAVKLTTPKSSSDISTSRIAKIDASQPIELTVDIHNNENPVHVLFWTPGVARNDGESTFNSDADGRVPGKGTGRNWGLVLDKASVTSAVAGAANFAE